MTSPDSPVRSATHLNISTYGFGEASLYKFFETQCGSGADALSETFKVIGSQEGISVKLKDLFISVPGNTCSVVGDEDATYLLLNGAPSEVDSGVIKIEGGCSSSTLMVVSGSELMGVISDLIKTNFALVGAKIHWVYAGDGSSTSIPVSVDNLPITEMYPNLSNTTLNEYYDRYITSSASILVLIGPPGTGKTSFLRGLLHHTSSSATVSYDPSILEHDSIFANFMSGNNKFMILEDSDSFLTSRAKGNTVMHKFLNVGDGLVSTRHKKIIFTTNLPSTRDIDPALIRPGRCFDVLHFDKLPLLNCEEIIKKLNIDVPLPADPVTLAELLNPGVTPLSQHKTVRGVGFAQ